MPPAVEIAWAAGFFDGEGHTSAASRSLRLALTQVVRENLERFARAMGGRGRIYGPRKAKRGNDYYHWQTPNRPEAMKCLELLWPLLGEAKREQARAAVSRLTRS